MGDYSTSAESNNNVCIIDMRSDTQSKPTREMRDAMANQTTGDHVYGEDPTIRELESKMAEMFGKEAALFIPSGTMGNLLGISCHCPSRGLEVLMGDQSHTFLCEQGGISQFCGLHARTVPNLPDGTFDLEVLENCIRPRNDPHSPMTGLIVVENTHNFCGGKALPLNFLPNLRKIADKHELPIHLDGSRIINAAVAQNVQPSELAKYVDSVNFCFSKGIGAPIGSALIGSTDFIAKAIRMRKALGGGWRKAGGLAAAALIGISDATERFKNDHKNAKFLAQTLADEGKGVLSVDVENIQTNIVIAEVTKDGLTAAEFCARIAKVSEEEKETHEDTAGVIVRAYHFGRKVVRFVTYSSLTEQDVRLATEKICFVIRECKMTASDIL